MTLHTYTTKYSFVWQTTIIKTLMGCSVRHQALDISSLDAVEAERVQHGLVVESVQIHGFGAFGRRVLVFVPRWHAERVALLPLKLFAGYLGVALARDDVVDGRGGLADGWACTASIQSLGGAPEDLRD